MDSSDNLKKVRVLARHISMLMEHQEISPDIKDIITELRPEAPSINRNSPEYLLGAYEALIHLIEDLEQKGS